MIGLLKSIRRVTMPALATAALLLAPQLSGAAGSAFPGTNGLIFFVSNRATFIEGWVTPPEGGGPKRLKLGARSASWSPDGRRIAFGAGEEIYVVNANGSGLRRLTDARSRGTEPTWSPDGSQILFLSRGGFYLMSPDGTGRRRLKRTALCVSGPKWSPDGSRIAFAAVCRQYAVYVMDSDGSDVRQIAVGDNPDWSPDGTQLAIDTGLRPLRIEVMNADGSARRTLTSGGEPAWSPDRKRVAFARQEQSVCDPQDRVTRLVSVNLDGTDEVEVTRRTSSGSCEFRDSNPDWQPRCTRYGTKRSDRLTGAAGRDIICALAGNDTVRVAGGQDVVISGNGKDVVDGGPGADWLFGSAGDDLILARDGEADIVNGGPGRDRARIDRGLDRVSGIEHVLK